MRTPLPWLLAKLSEGNGVKSQQRAQWKDHCTTTCSIEKEPRILLQVAKRQSGCPWWFCDAVRSHWCERPCLGCSGTLRGERASSRNKGIGTPLPCRLPLHPCCVRSSNGCRWCCRFCDAVRSHCRNVLALLVLFPESGCGMVSVPLMLPLVASGTH